MSCRRFLSLTRLLHEAIEDKVELQSKENSFVFAESLPEAVSLSSSTPLASGEFPQTTLTAWDGAFANVIEIMSEKGIPTVTSPHGMQSTD